TWWGNGEETKRFLEGIATDLVKERERFRTGQGQQPALPGMQSPQQARDSLLQRYEVNVFISRDPDAGAPVIVERHPTYYNVIGRIEYTGQYGSMVTNHRQIKAGSLALANGGFMILRLRELLQ